MIALNRKENNIMPEHAKTLELTNENFQRKEGRLGTLLKVDGEWKIMNKIFHLH